MDALNLSVLLADVAAPDLQVPDVAVTGIAYRSSMVRRGDAFFCVPGFAADGHDFAGDAAARGAAVIVAMHALPGIAVPVTLVPDTRVALALASARFFGRPSGAMDVVGITGTNGKTTTTYLLDAILRAAGRHTGLIGTIESRVDGVAQAASRTTPESRDLQELLATMRDASVTAVSMEVSSHAVDLHRVDGVDFAVAAFTNLSQDHLDYHATMEEYFSVKAAFVGCVDADRRVVNVDDEHGARLAASIGARWTVGTSAAAAVRASSVSTGASSCSFRLESPVGDVDVVLPLAGAYNVSNALVAAGCALALGIPVGVVAEGLSGAPQVPGRLERIDAGQDFTVLVDYAHTPDGLANALQAVGEVTKGRVIIVFGCGGDRDPDKRPLMGHVAGMLSDIAILTSDNPRSEDPVGIVLQVQDGMEGTPARLVIEIDRRAAIVAALAMAQRDDTVLVAGKGHEDYQIFADRTVHFDDREVVREELAKSW
jgi:UDP-N-acetylmuramoyl-L-alanyl-D-glutamate--2,6-diaminopimelate ligase